jgi:bifunctional non-homologous end joining protein LigD
MAARSRPGFVHVHPDTLTAALGVRLTSLDKVLWPAVGFTKAQMLDYYARVAPVLLTHVAGRPLTLGRFPEGVDGPGFAQIECRGRPEWMETASVRLRDGRARRFCVARDARSLLWIANLGTIELHVFLAGGRDLERPAAVLFDLDPEPPAGSADACRVAVLVRDRLALSGLRSVVKTTGGSGLHVLVPLASVYAYEQTRRFARTVAESLADAVPGVVARAGRRERRVGTVLIDWAQNHERRSMVAPYSLRANVVPLVAAPVSWEEVERGASGASLWVGPAEALERIERLGDLFAPALGGGQKLPGCDVLSA